MRKIFLLFILFNLFIFCNLAKAEDLNLQAGELYLLDFDEEIENLYTNDENLDVQMVYTIFDGNKQILICLNDGETSILQVKTTSKLYNFNIKNSSQVSENLLKIDLPPIENLSVDKLGAD